MNVFARMKRQVALIFCLAFLLTAVAPAGVSSAQTEKSSSRVVVIGIPGLLWSDLSSQQTPHLWKLVGDGASASLVVRSLRSRTCAAAGWLTLSAGQRAADRDGSCYPPPVQRMGEGAQSLAIDTYTSANMATAYKADVGWLGEQVHRAGRLTAAVGPGGVLGAMDRSGAVDSYARTVETSAPWDPYSLIAVDVEDIGLAWESVQPTIQQKLEHQARADEEPLPAPVLTDEARASAVAAADEKVGRVLAKVPVGTTVIVAGLADVPPTTHLRVAVATGPTPQGQAWERGYLRSDSTRAEGLVTLPDTTATIAATLDLPAPATGRPFAQGSHVSATAEIVDELSTNDADAVEKRGVVALFLHKYTLCVVAVYLLLLFLLRLPRVSERPRLLMGVRVASVTLGASATATFLMQLIPWWRMDHPAVGAGISLVGCALLITALAFAGPWRAHSAGPAAVTAASSVLLLTAEVMTGSYLQTGGVTGYDPLSGARFFGFGNIAFAIYATSLLLLMGLVFHFLERKGHQRQGLVAAGVIGVLGVVVDVWPAWGADFGGAIALIPAVSLLLLMLSGRHISVWRAIAALVVAVGAVLLVSFIDWLRPENQRTHLGVFFGDILDGDAWSTVERKTTAMLNTFTNVDLVVLVAASIFFALVTLLRREHVSLLRPLAPTGQENVGRTSLLSQLYVAVPPLRATTIAVGFCVLVGFLVNDSGLAIPAFALIVSVPLLTSAALHPFSLNVTSRSITHG